ncbi:MAG: hypothetical protein IPO56_03765 [Flavobacteriales bacterium]|nr:hypothetical protein [Flavobacteriales bacterium]
MKKLILPAALLLASTFAQAQIDTTNTPEGLQGRSLQLGVSAKDGAFARVSSPDSTKKPNPLVITTQRKKITILTETRDWTSESDSINDRLKDIRTERRNQFTYWSGVDVGLNMLLGPNGSTNLPKESEFMELDQANSRFVSINFMEQKIEFGSHHVGLLTGLGWKFTNYRFKGNDPLQFQNDSVFSIPVEDPQFRKNKLRQSGFRMPLMLEFNTKRAKMPTAEEMAAARRDTVGGKRPPNYEFRNNKNFHVALGVVGTWYYDSMYKLKYSQNGATQKDVDKGEHDLLPYRLAAAARIGYGGFNLFAEYALTPLFENNKGPKLTPFNVGITIIGFN